MSPRSGALALVAFSAAVLVALVLASRDPQPSAVPEAAQPSGVQSVDAGLQAAAALPRPPVGPAPRAAQPAPGASAAAQPQLPPVHLVGRSLDQVKASIRARARARADAAGKLAQLDARVAEEDARRERHRQEREARHAAAEQRRLEHDAELSAGRERMRAVRGSAARAPGPSSGG